MQGWGKVPAAHASDTLRTACLWGEFGGCGQRGGGRREKGAAEAVGGIDVRTECLHQRPTARGGATGREIGLEVQIRVRANVRKFERERAAERVWECALPSICEASVCVWWSSR